MRVEDLDLRELLEIDPEGGIIRFAGQRALIIDAFALGLLRKHLAESLGMTAARAVLTRFGFAHGWRTSESLRTEFDWDTEQDWMRSGGRINALQGLFRVEPGSRGPLSETGATWAASYEAEQHLLHFGQAETPVCWVLTGLASGHLSRALGREVYVVEDRCVGKGDAACHIVARTLETWGDSIKEQLPYFKDEGLEASLHQITGELKRTEKKLRERKRQLALARGGNLLPEGLSVKSRAMRDTVEMTKRVAKVDATVLVTGESGVGKERIARLVHDESPRSSGPFIAVNCGSIAESLLESELFGHAKGAFTGARHDRIGFFEAANGGTLLLDELGEISAGMQVKLLRVLQEREVRRVGENTSRPVDVRVVAATNRDLGAEVAAGRFRRDLYFRLKVVELHIPPLRDRRDDILPLARLLLAQAAGRAKRSIDGFSAQTAHKLLHYDWPGNVRELENVMERAVALAAGQRIEVEDLPTEVLNALPSFQAKAKTLADVERDYILSSLAKNAGNQAETAAQLGIGTATLYRKLKAYGKIDRPRRRG